MELIQIIEAMLMSFTAGIFTAALLNSHPYQQLLRYLKLDTFQKKNPLNKLVSCCLCMGYWISIATLYITGFSILYTIIFAGIGSIVAELTERKLQW